ncbi:MAG: subclass B1 metallo-beta-lactamase [Flavobacteriaceae bacterium]|jgi:metallo-beta-lactamase class B|nr:subclass B1 metallo-beta-lactamase [Flavobacteriaceae bacterium]
MRSLKFTIFILSFFIFLTSCNSPKKNTYHFKLLDVTPITQNTYIHTSYLNTHSFGKVSCNGLLFINGDKAVIFDTPVDENSSQELINWLKDYLHVEIVGVVVSHFHTDCLGGLQVFHDENIKSYSTYLTQELARKDTISKPVIPQIGFDKELVLKVGNQKINAVFLGEGHTKDNIVSYIPSEKVLFGGCLIKELNAGKGNLSDANVEAWPKSVENVKNAFPEAKYIVPGHGKYGTRELLDYTINLFKESN